MKRLTDKIRTLILLALLISCGEEEHPCRNYGSDALLRLQSVRAGETVRTRSGGNVPLLDVAIPVGFWVKELSQADGNVVYDTQNNVKGGYDSDDSAWQPLPSNPVWLNTYTANLAVYAPYDATQGADGDGILSLSANLYQADRDLAAARFTGNNRSTGLNITMKRLYVRLTFTFVKYAEYTEEATIDKFELTGADIYQKATYSLFADSNPYVIAPATGFTKSFSPGLEIGTDTDASDAARIDLLLIPTGAAFTEDALLTVTSGDKVMKVPVLKTLFSGGRLFSAGKQYNFMVRLSVSSVDIEENDVKTTDWENAGTDVEAGSEFD